MNPARLASLSAEWRVKREALLTAFPELADDPEALVDTLDGAAEALDVVAWLGRKSKEAEADAEAMTSLLHSYEARAARHKNRQACLRRDAQALLEHIGETTVQRPEITITLRPGPKRVLLVNQMKLPATYWRHGEPQPDKIKIKEALEAGQEVPGASLSNGAAVLTVRVA